MSENTEGNGSTAAALSRFVSERVSPLAKAFASTPLHELRVRTSEGYIRLVKAAEPPAPPRTSSARPALRGARQQLLPAVESGHPYDIISADVVGIFAAAPGAPQPGERIADDAVLGYIEALKLKHPVRSGGAGLLVAQVVEDGQAVDFGEPMFVVDREAPAPKTPEPAPEILEPPRL